MVDFSRVRLNHLHLVPDNINVVAEAHAKAKPYTLNFVSNLSANTILDMMEYEASRHPNNDAWIPYHAYVRGRDWPKYISQYEADKLMDAGYNTLQSGYAPGCVLLTHTFAGTTFDINMVFGFVRLVSIVAQMGKIIAGSAWYNNMDRDISTLGYCRYILMQALATDRQFLKFNVVTMGQALLVEAEMLSGPFVLSWDVPEGKFLGSGHAPALYRCARNAYDMCPIIYDMEPLHFDTDSVNSPADSSLSKACPTSSQSSTASVQPSLG